MAVEIKNYSFQELNVNQLYDVLKLRVDVFVVEQECAYEELDNQDQNAVHVLACPKSSAELVAYARILFEKGDLHIGRIVVKKEYRNQGIAQELMHYCLNYCTEHWPNEPIYLSAQAHLEHYYQTFGFQTSSEPYDWDGIMHVDMKLAK